VASNIAVSLAPGTLSWYLTNSQLGPYVSDPDGNGVTLTNAFSITPGVTVGYYATGGGYVSYNRPKGLTNDSFSYVVTDGQLNATARVDLAVAPVGSRTVTARRSGTSIVISDVGTPGLLYDLLWSTNLAGWQISGVCTAAPNGTVYYSEPATNALKFYQLQSSMKNELP
jgi:hypothetical protein